MLRSVLGFSLLLTLFGCSEYVESPSYLEGTFVGFYQTDEQATPVGLRIQTGVTAVRKARYTFAGTATLGSRSYTAEGYEEANPNLGYLSVQALPPMGNLVMNFTDPGGTFVYSLCSKVFYDAENKDTPYTFRDTYLYKKACDPSTPVYEGTFAAVNLQRYGP